MIVINASAFLEVLLRSTPGLAMEALLTDAPIERVPCRELLTTARRFGPAMSGYDALYVRPRREPAMPASHDRRAPGTYRNNTVQPHRDPRSDQWPVRSSQVGGAQSSGSSASICARASLPSLTSFRNDPTSKVRLR